MKPAYWGTSKEISRQELHIKCVSILVDKVDQKACWTGGANKYQLRAIEWTGESLVLQFVKLHIMRIQLLSPV